MADAPEIYTGSLFRATMILNASAFVKSFGLRMSSLRRFIVADRKKELEKTRALPRRKRASVHVKPIRDLSVEKYGLL